MKSVGEEPYKLNSKELNQLEFFHSFISSGIPINGGVYQTLEIISTKAQLSFLKLLLLKTFFVSSIRVFHLIF